MADTVSFTVRMRFSPEDRADITEILTQLTAVSRQESGCLTYIAHWSEAASDTVLIYEQYKDRAAHEAHRNSSHFQKFAVGGLYQRMKERDVEDLHVIA
jgi:quinol monooxygenase YgiN